MGNIFIDRKNRLRLTSNDFLARFENGKIIPVTQVKNASFSIVENIDGNLLVKFENKIYRLTDDKPGKLLIDEPDYLARARVMIADREGNL